MTYEAYKIRYYTSYSGIKLPLKLVGEIPTEEMSNRNTYYQACLDEQERLCICRKIVYGEIGVEHLYGYHENGIIKQVTINEDGEITTLNFDEQGKRI